MIFRAFALLILLWPLPALAQGGGYAGVIAPAPKEDQKTETGAYSFSTPVKPQKTPLPGGTDRGIKTKEDLESAAMIKSFDKDHDGVPDGIAKMPRFTGKLSGVMAGEPELIDGKYTMEYVVSENIQRLMPLVRDERLPLSQRKENAKNIESQFLKTLQGVQAESQVPDKMYKDMGLPDAYLVTQKEERRRVVALLLPILQELKKYK